MEVKAFRIHGWVVVVNQMSGKRVKETLTLIRWFLT